MLSCLCSVPPLALSGDCYLVQLSSLLESYDLFQGWIYGHGSCQFLVKKIGKPLLLDLFPMCKYLGITIKPSLGPVSDKLKRLNSVSLTEYNLFSSCRMKPPKPFISGIVTRLRCYAGMWEDSSKDFRLTCWYSQWITVWGDFDISFDSDCGFKNLMAVLGLSNGFATSEQESSSLLWKADVPPGFSMLCRTYSWYHFFFLPFSRKWSYGRMLARNIRALLTPHRIHHT